MFPKDEAEACLFAGRPAIFVLFFSKLNISSSTFPHFKAFNMNFDFRRSIDNVLYAFMERTF